METSTLKHESANLVDWRKLVTLFLIAKNGHKMAHVSKNLGVTKKVRKEIAILPDFVWRNFGTQLEERRRKGCHYFKMTFDRRVITAKCTAIRQPANFSLQQTNLLIHKSGQTIFCGNHSTGFGWTSPLAKVAVSEHSSL